MQWKRERGEKKSIHWGMALKKAIKKKGGEWVIKIPDTEHDGCKYPYTFLLCRQLPGGVHAPSPGNCVLRKELCRCQNCLMGFQKLWKSKLMHWEMSFGNKISVSSLWQSTGCMRWGEHFSSYGERSASLIWGGSEILQQAFHWGGPNSGSGVISINRLLSHGSKVNHYIFFLLSRKAYPLLFPWAATWYSMSQDLFLIPAACSCGSPGWCWGHSTFQRRGALVIWHSTGILKPQVIHYAKVSLSACRAKSLILCWLRLETARKM